MGMGDVETHPRIHTGINYWNTDLITHQNILKDIHVLTIEYIQKFYSVFMGSTLLTLTESTDMTIKVIDPNNAGNRGLINHYKIRLSRLSAVLHFILKNNMTRTRYMYFKPSKEKFAYTD